MEKLHHAKDENISKDKQNQVLHMNGGEGKTSYAKNSKTQGMIISMITKPMLKEAVVSLYNNNARSIAFADTISIADLGCSSGPNALLVVSEIMHTIEAKSREFNCSSQQYQLFLNDLPSTDFNTVFKSVCHFHEKRKEGNESPLQCFIFGVPGSFYGRLFPNKSLHLVNSSYGLHWLSQVPPELKKDARIALNKGQIYISETSPPVVAKAYLTQFQRDFSLFLRSRSEEIVPGGNMVLTLRGRRVADPATIESCLYWNLMAKALNELVEEGAIEEKQVDSFNLPYYEPIAEEIKHEIQRERSFELRHFDVVVTDWDKWVCGENCDIQEIAQSMTNLFRAITEPILKCHFDTEVMDPLYEKFCKLVESRENAIPLVTLTFSLIKRG